MPARSNAFQRLVFVVRQHVAGDAIVTESEMLTDRETGETREVDITVRGTVGGHPVRISLECRDHLRRADVMWVEQMWAKHLRLPTSELILVSRSGFSKSARSLAKQKGIELMELDSPNESRLADILGPSSAVWTKSWKLTLGEIEVSVPATESLPAETFLAELANDIFDESGTLIGPAGGLAAAILRSDIIATELSTSGGADHTWFEASAEPPRTSANERMYVKKIEPSIFRPIDRFLVRGTCSIAVNELKLKRGRLGRVSIAWGEGKIDNTERLVVLSDSGGSELKVTVLPANKP